MNESIEQLEEINVYQNPWISVFFDRVKAANPNISRYTRIVECQGRSGVVILPIKGNEIGLVQVFRYPIGCEMWEAPRGFGESLDPMEDAARELREETGIAADAKLIRVGHVYPNSGLLANNAIVFAAICRDDTCRDIPPDDEISEFRWFDKTMVQEMIIDGRITDGFTITALFQAVLHGLVAISSPPLRGSAT